MTALARRLGLADAVVVGLSAMIGAGAFVVFAPAAALAGGLGLLLAVAIAGAIAYCNATSSARLAARYPESGGTYVYGRERLGPVWGYLAGCAFVLGKTASCAAMALAVGVYVWPEHARAVGVAAVAVLTAVNLRGIAKTALAARLFLAVALAALAAVLAAGGAGLPLPLHVGEVTGGVHGVLGAAGLVFFAFAGYARIATLGEEVRDPARTIPRAIGAALAIVVALYLLLALTTVLVLGDRLPGSPAPLADVVRAAGAGWLAPVVRVGAAVAVTGVLLSLLAGVGRTTLAMARRGDLPRALAAVHERYAVPHVAESCLAIAVVALVLLVDLRAVIGFSSVTVLVYYAVANASAVTLGPGRGRVVAVLGVAGCAVVAVSLPWRGVVLGALLLLAALGAYGLRRRRRDG